MTNGQRAAVTSMRAELQRGLDAAEAALTTTRSRCDLVIALFAVGMAAAFCDRHVAGSELAEIDGFVADAATSGMPPHLKGRITRLRNHPPSLEAAMKQVAKVDPGLWDLFGWVIELVIGADGVIRDEEIALRQAWEEWRAQHR